MWGKQRKLLGDNRGWGLGSKGRTWEASRRSDIHSSWERDFRPPLSKPRPLTAWWLSEEEPVSNSPWCSSWRMTPPCPRDSHAVSLGWTYTQGAGRARWHPCYIHTDVPSSLFSFHLLPFHLPGPRVSPVTNSLKGKMNSEMRCEIRKKI